MAGVEIFTAERPGEDGLSEDRVYAAGQVVVVLDGVSSLDPGNRDGWYPDALGHRIVDLLTTGRAIGLAEALSTAIGHVAADHDLVPGEAPASTVAIVRWTDRHLEGLVLGDSPVIVFGDDGRVDVLRDGRHDRVVAEVRREAIGRLGLSVADGGALGELIKVTRPAKRARMNREGGYWIAEADPQAGYRSLLRRWPIGKVRAVLAVTDGVSGGVDDYGVPASWPQALEIALTDGLGELLAVVHRAEVGDLERRRWPRAKVHDDKAAGFVVFPRPVTEKGSSDRVR